MKVKLGPCHGDAKNAAFFFDLLGGYPAHMSEGMQPSVTFRMKTASHSCPLAEWMVDRMRCLRRAPVPGFGAGGLRRVER